MDKQNQERLNTFIGFVAVFGLALALVLVSRFMRPPSDSDSTQGTSGGAAAPAPVARKAAARPNPNPAKIHGVVRDEEGNPIEGALIETMQPSSEYKDPGAGATSSKDGEYALGNLRLGNR